MLGVVRPLQMSVTDGLVDHKSYIRILHQCIPFQYNHSLIHQKVTLHRFHYFYTMKNNYLNLVEENLYVLNSFFIFK